MEKVIVHQILGHNKGFMCSGWGLLTEELMYIGWKKKLNVLWLEIVQ